MENEIEAVKIEILKIINDRITDSKNRKISKSPWVIGDLVDFYITGLESQEEIETMCRDAYDEVVFDSRNCPFQDDSDEEAEMVGREMY